MRRVLRSVSSVPDFLRGIAVNRAKDVLQEHYRLPDTERLRRRPPLERRLWAEASVMDALFSVFHSKCAYCESPVGAGQAGEVSHRRPTSSAVGLENHRDAEPSPDHYGWLAYEWQNLFLACAACNRAKRNIFPVVGPRARIRSTWKEAEESEQALLVNPCRMDPRRHLGFRMDGKVLGKTECGNVTIGVLALDREELVSARSRKFRRCIKILELVRRDQTKSDQLQLELSDTAPFSGCARSALFDLLRMLAKMENLPNPTFRSLLSDAIRIALVTSDMQWARLLDFGLADSPGYDPMFDWMLTDEPVLQAQPQRLREEPRTSQLQRIIIHNFKGIRSLDLQVTPTHWGDGGAPCMMLLGENSTGKSSTLQAIALTLMSQKQRSQVGVSAEDFIPREDAGWELNESAVPLVTLEFDSGAPVEFRIDTTSKAFVGQLSSSFLIFAYGSRRFFDEDINKSQTASRLRSLFRPFAKIQHPGRWLQELSSKKFDAVARAIRPVLVLRDEDHIGRDSAGRLYVQAHGRETPLERLSDGYRSLLAMILDVMRGMLEEWSDLDSARGIVLIDELETHLHPRWKLRVVSALREAMPNVQFIATTHDPLCLRGMRDGEVQVLERKEDHSIQALTGLPDVRGLRAEQLLTSEYFGLSSTSDPELEGALNRLVLPTSQQVALREHDREVIRSLQWIGNTPAEQVANEALRRFVEEAAHDPELDRSEVREGAVNEVLARLRQASTGGRQ